MRKEQRKKGIHRKVRILLFAGILLAVSGSSFIRAETEPETIQSEKDRPGPVTEKTDPATEKPEPGTEKPDPATEKPEPGTEKPDPATEKPEPGTEKPDPATEKPEPGTEKPDPATEKPEPDTEEQKSGKWYVRISDVSPSLPAGGRIYDGTTDIDVSFSWQLVPVKEASPGGGKLQGMVPQETAPQKTAPQETVPEVKVICDARLKAPDAGIRQVEYSFRYEPDLGDTVSFDPDNIYPNLEVIVQKKVLSVRMPDGKKVYSDPADMAHIWPSDSDVADMNKNPDRQKRGVVPEQLKLKAEVTGFVNDKDGNPLIPDGFQPPEPDIDPEVLKDNSPMFSGGQKIRYESAIVMKHREDGSLTGDPTANYSFCEEPGSPGYIRGSVEIVKKQIRENEDYVTESGGFSVRDGSILLKSGDGFSVKPADKSVFNKGFTKKKIYADGTASFTLKKISADGQILAESLPAEISWLADGQVPEAALKLSGGHIENEVRYYSDSCSCLVIPRGDDRSGLAKAAWRVRKGDDLPAPGRSLQTAGEWTEIKTDAASEITIGREGIWQIEACTTDRLGNQAFSLSQVFVIDKQKPVCRISGAGEESANSGDVQLTFSCSDRWYQKGSARITVTPLYGSYTPKEQSRSEDNDGLVVRLEDFEHSRAADSWYHATITVRDLAGNSGKAERTFSVNRFGSTYGLSPETLAGISTYYHRQPFDVTFLETNLDEVGQPKILVMKSGKKLSGVKAEREKLRSAQSEKDGMKHYRYRISADTFSDDGTYDVILMTSDRAGNSSDSQMQNLPVRFAIDSERPECLVSGISRNEVFRQKQVIAVSEVRDNLALKSATVYLNTKVLKEYSASEIERAGGVLKTIIQEKEDWQRLQIHVEDQAGNEFWTEEYPVFVSEEKEKPPEMVLKKSARQLAEEREQSVKRKKRKEQEGKEDKPADKDETDIRTENLTETHYYESARRKEDDAGRTTESELSPVQSVSGSAAGETGGTGPFADDPVSYEDDRTEETEDTAEGDETDPGSKRVRSAVILSTVILAAFPAAFAGCRIAENGAVGGMYGRKGRKKHRRIRNG